MRQIGVLKEFPEIQTDDPRSAPVPDVKAQEDAADRVVMNDGVAEEASESGLDLVPKVPARSKRKSDDDDEEESDRYTLRNGREVCTRP